MENRVIESMPIIEWSNAFAKGIRCCQSDCSRTIGFRMDSIFYRAFAAIAHLSFLWTHIDGVIALFGQRNLLEFEHTTNSNEEISAREQKKRRQRNERKK